MAVGKKGKCRIRNHFVVPDPSSTRRYVHGQRKVRILVEQRQKAKGMCGCECVRRNIHKCHVRVSSFILRMHARFFDPVLSFPFRLLGARRLVGLLLLLLLLLLFVLLCARISIYNVWVCANEINSVALEAKIYYQIKFLTEFIALSLSPNIVLLPFGSLHNQRGPQSTDPPSRPQPPTEMNPPANEARPPKPRSPETLTAKWWPRPEPSGPCLTFQPPAHPFLLFSSVFVYRIYREQIWTICALYPRVLSHSSCVSQGCGQHASATLSLKVQRSSRSY